MVGSASYPELWLDDNTDGGHIDRLDSRTGVQVYSPTVIYPTWDTESRSDCTACQKEHNAQSLEVIASWQRFIFMLA